MQIYFVRHGETILNRHHIHQSPTTPLSALGKKQALLTAEHIRPLKPDLLLSSPYTRALETSRIIGLTLDMTVHPSKLFYEIRRPTSLCDRSLFHPKTIIYVLLSVWHRKNPKWRYEDAENFNDIYERVQNALAYIETLRKKHKTVVIVSHTMFINLVVSYMCKDRILAVRDLILSFLHIEQMKNGGVLEVDYNEKHSKNTCAWQLVKQRV